MLKNPTLAEAYENIAESVQDRESFDRIVKAGTKVIYDKAMFPELVKGLEEAPEPLEAVTEGIIGVLGMMFQRSRGTMPPGPMVQAGVALLIDALDFAEQAGMLDPVDGETLGRAVESYINSLLPKFGITPDKIQTTLEQVKATMDEHAGEIGGDK